MKIPIDAGTQSGKILRLRGKGIKDVNGYGAGDQLIHINVYTPTKVSAEEKKTLEQLRGSANFQPENKKEKKGFIHRMKEFFE